MSERLPLRMGIGLALGLGLGVLAHAAFGDAAWLRWLVHNLVEPAGQIFLRLLFMLVIPLIVSALALAVAELGDLRRLGRIGLKTLAYTATVSTIAVAIAVGLVNLFEPGAGLPEQLKQGLEASAHVPAAAPAAGRTGAEFIVNLVPSNVVKAMAEGDMLALMVFALLLGVGVAAAPGEPARRLEEVLRGLQDVTMWLLGLVIQLAPFGVACLVFVLATRLGLEIFRSLAAYVGVVLLGLALQQFVVYAASVSWLGGMSPRRFYRGVRAAMVDRVLDGLEQRHPPDRALGGGARAAAAEPRQPLRPHARLDREPERHRPVRGRDGAVPRAALRRGSLALAAAHGLVHLRARRHRHGGRAGRLDPGDRDDPRHRRACPPRASAWCSAWTASSTCAAPP